jgi:ubiquitin C-terminal hydrolase
MCSGCILPPTGEFIEDFFKKAHLAIEWHSSLIEEDYNQAVNEVIYHSSITEEKEVQEEGALTLDDCLKKFYETEQMTEASELINCTVCKKPQPHDKKLDLNRPPPVLIIQLKRFKFSSTYRNKLQTLVDFP